MHALLSRSCHFSSVLGGGGTVRRGVSLGLSDDVPGGVMGLLQDPRNLTAYALNRVPDSDVGAGQLGLQIVDLAVQLGDVGIDLFTVVATP